MELWERQPDEVNKRYSAFCIYRDMGRERSLVKVSNAVGKSKSYIKWLQRVSVEENWVKRAGAYDDYLEKKKREENEAAISEMNKRHIQAALMMQKNIFEKLKTIKSNKVSVIEMTKMLDLAVRIERQARGCDYVESRLNYKNDDIEQDEDDNIVFIDDIPETDDED
jgi:hypothetical protein